MRVTILIKGNEYPERVAPRVLHFNKCIHFIISSSLCIGTTRVIILCGAYIIPCLCLHACCVLTMFLYILFGTSILTSFNILVKMLLHFYILSELTEILTNMKQSLDKVSDKLTGIDS